MTKLQAAISKITEIRNTIDLIKQSEKYNKRRITQLETQIQHMMLEYAADIELFQYIKCWMIEIFGHSELTKEDYDNIKFDEEGKIDPPTGVFMKDYINDILTKSGGNLGHSINEYLKEQQINYSHETQRDIWAIKIHCTAESADIICDLIYKKFYKAINSKLIRVVRKPWNFEFETGN